MRVLLFVAIFVALGEAWMFSGFRRLSSRISSSLKPSSSSKSSSSSSSFYKTQIKYLEERLAKDCPTDKNEEKDKRDFDDLREKLWSGWEHRSSKKKNSKDKKPSSKNQKENSSINQEKATYENLLEQLKWCKLRNIGSSIMSWVKGQKVSTTKHPDITVKKQRQSTTLKRTPSTRPKVTSTTASTPTTTSTIKSTTPTTPSTTTTTKPTTSTPSATTTTKPTAPTTTKPITSTTKQTTSTTTTNRETPQPTTKQPATTASPCQQAKNLTDSWRKDHSGSNIQPGGSHSSNGYACDTTDNTQWFRFTGAAGNELLDSCPKPFSCGGATSLWTDDYMPKLVDDEVVINAFGADSQGCRSVTVELKVIRCSWDAPGDFAYKLATTNQSPCSQTLCGMSSL